MASDNLHEPEEKLAAETIDRHRAIRSVMEELEAIDWYDQRVDATENAELKAILAHNRDEEKEHACMVLEWIRRHDAKFDQLLRQYLFRSGAIEDERDEQSRPEDGDGTLGIGSLRAAEAEAQ